MLCDALVQAPWRKPLRLFHVCSCKQRNLKKKMPYHKRLNQPRPKTLAHGSHQHTTLHTSHFSQPLLVFRASFAVRGMTPAQLLLVDCVTF